MLELDRAAPQQIVNKVTHNKYAGLRRECSFIS